MSLVFYDTETTGTEPFFDQILQFAAVQTDEDLNELDRFDVRCRILPHVVPAPSAMSVTGVKVSQLIDPSTPSHYEMARAISAKLESWSPALFIGWNSMEFDEKFVRQALYKTLHNPYLTNRVGNSRSDVMRIAQACSLMAPDALVFPTSDDGKKIFKLDRMAPANGFKHDHAHDAMNDVEATIFLCGILMNRAPEVWSSFMRFSTKASVVAYITEEPIFCMSEFYYGKPFSFLVTTIGQSQTNPAEWYAYDLRFDPEELRSLTTTQLLVRLAQSPKLVRRLKSNGVPMLCPVEDAPEICKGREFDLDEFNRRAEVLRADAVLREHLISALESQKGEYPPSPHVEKHIYDGFPEESDEQLMDEFHKVAWPNRCQIVKNFKDQRLQAIGTRLIHLERPELLSEFVQREQSVAAARRLLGLGEDISWLTLPKALSEIQRMIEEASGQELVILREHQKYLQELQQKALRNLE